MDAPVLKTPLPGPKAAALIARDTGDRVAVLHARLSARDGRRPAARWSRTWTATCSSTAPPASPSTSTGHAHPDVVKAIVDQAQRFLHMSGTDFYYEPQVQLAEEMAEIVPITGGGEDVLRQLGHRGRRSVGEAGEVPHEAASASSRSSARSTAARMGSLSLTSSKTDAAAGLRAAAAGRVPRAVRELLPLPGRHVARTCAGRVPGLHRGPDPRRTSSRPTKSRPSSSSRSRAKAATSCRRPQFHQRLRELTTKHGMLLVADEVQSGMGRTGKMFAHRALRRRARHHRDRQGHRVGHAARRLHARGPT